MVDPNWTRWIEASINKYFDDRRGSYLLIIKGEVSQIKDNKKWVELVVHGPSIRTQAKGEFYLYVDIHLMCTVISSENIYESSQMVGYFQSLLTDIAVMKYGDDASYFGCLTLREDVPRPIDTIQWGKADPSIDAEKISIDASYKLEIKV